MARLTVLAELEVRHSRLVAPTRRVALGEAYLPADPPPGHGGLLLGAIVAAYIGAVDDEVSDGYDRLLADLESGRRVVQPRLRFRFQGDTHGLDRSRHRLVAVGAAVGVDLEDRDAPLPQLLAAAYAAGGFPSRARPDVFRVLRRATRWTGGGAGQDAVDHRTIEWLAGDEAAGLHRHRPGDERWALDILGFPASAEPARGEIQRRFRVLVRHAHPDVGGSHDRAGQRIVDLTEAKRILLGA